MADRGLPVPILGFLLGSAGIGVPVALAHVLTNDLGATDAAILGLACALTYGGLAGTALGVVGVLARLVRWPTSPEGVLRLGLSVCLWVYLLGWVLYGRTYDDAPFGPATDRADMVLRAAGMAGLLLVAAVLVATPLAWASVRLAQLRRALPMAALLIALCIPPAGAVLRPATVLPAPPRVDTIQRQQGGAPLVVLVGLDGADWRVMEPMIARGELPNFARMVERGTSGPLRTLPEENSSTLWATIYTGTTPERHGVHDFFRIALPGMTGGVFPVHGTYFSELSLQLSRIGLARFEDMERSDLTRFPLWEITDAAGIPTGLVDGYYYSVPAPRLRTDGGYAVGHRADQWIRSGNDEDAGRFVQPVALAAEVKSTLVGPDLDRQAAMTLHLLRTRPLPGFLNFYTHEPDSTEHRNWKWYEPDKFYGVKQEDLDRNADKIPERYRTADRFVGELRALTGPDAVVMVVSDHGHSPTLLQSSIQSQHRFGPPGVLLADGGPIRAGARIDASVLDVAPTVLWMLGLPVPEDVDGQVRTEIVDPEHAARVPVRSIPSYEGFMGAHPEDGARDHAQEEIEKLRALGYL